MVRIDGRAVARTRMHDGAGRPLAAWPGCRRLQPGEVFLLAAGNTASFDGRYFGPVPRTVVFGEADAGWTWCNPGSPGSCCGPSPRALSTPAPDQAGHPLTPTHAPVPAHP